ncbi:MAG: methyltransferase domain-containing protein [Acetobacteraceae bacterium]
MARLWPDAAGQSVLGLGYAAPYLRVWRDGARRCVAATPAQIGIARWPSGAAGLSCTVDEDALPFTDLSVDRILLVHGLENAENARRMLREVWRVLKDDGRLLVGGAQPRRACGRMWRTRRSARASPTRRVRSAACSPPACSGWSGGTPRSICRPPACAWCCAAPGCSSGPAAASCRIWRGVTITEAVKDVYAAVPWRGAANKRRRLVLSETA